MNSIRRSGDTCSEMVVKSRTSLKNTVSGRRSPPRRASTLPETSWRTRFFGTYLPKAPSMDFDVASAAARSWISPTIERTAGVGAVSKLRSAAISPVRWRSGAEMAWAAR